MIKLDVAKNYFYFSLTARRIHANLKESVGEVPVDIQSRQTYEHLSGSEVYCYNFS